MESNLFSSRRFRTRNNYNRFFDKTKFGFREFNFFETTIEFQSQSLTRPNIEKD